MNRLYSICGMVVIALLLMTSAQAQNYYLGNNDANCGCHSATVTSWQATGHYKAQDSITYLSYSCLECHNTGWDVSNANYGTDDYVVMDTSVSPNWTITDSTNWLRVRNVQCEECHGPLGDASRTRVSSHGSVAILDYSSQSCGTCHDGAHHPYKTEWDSSGHATGAPGYVQSNPSCYRCHFAQDFIGYVDDPTGYDYTTFARDTVLQDITCPACHDAHGTDKVGDIRDVSALPHMDASATICDACHNAHIDSVDVNSTPHHSTSEIMYGSTLFGYQFPDETYDNSYHVNISRRCYECHVYTSEYVSADTPAVTGHTYEPFQEACVPCHSDITSDPNVDTTKPFNYRGIQDSIHNLMADLGALLAAANRADSSLPIFKQALYNYKSAGAEASFGIHNTDLVAKLLIDSKEKYAAAEKPNFYLGDPANNCGCHSDVVTTWQTTGHYWAHDSALTNSHYGYSCLGCHNTGWTDIDNGGADEYVVLDTTSTPNFTVTNATEWADMKNIGCESCHGPLGDETGAFLGVADHQTAAMIDYSSENCGSCHQGAHHPYMEEWQNSGHATGAPGFVQSNPSCYRCHFAEDFIGYVKDPTNYDPATFARDSVLQDVTCPACHDMHGTDHPGQLRDVTHLPHATADHTVCDACHNAHIDTVDVNTTPHHATSEVFDGSPLFGYQYPDSTYTNSAHTMSAAVPDRCYDCHVHPSPYDGVTAVTAHTYEPRVVSCVEACHTDYFSDPNIDTSVATSKFDYRGTQTKVRGLMDSLGTYLANASTTDSATFTFKAALYNYLAVQSEGSYGIHNTSLVVGLLEDAIADVETTLDISDDNNLSNIIPDVYELSQNYPNPFNPSTTIRFGIPKASDVKVVVYNSIGEQVTVLVNKDLNAGYHEVQWNAGTMASGVYFYRIEAENFVQTKKMLLLK